LNLFQEVQTTLRSAVRHLRSNQLPSLTPPHPSLTSRNPSSSQIGLSEIGSSGRGHSLSLLDTLVFAQDEHEDSNSPSNVSKGLPKIQVEGVSKASSLIQAELQRKENDAALSLSALRAQKDSWKCLRESLEEISRNQKDLKEVRRGGKGKGKVKESSRETLTTSSYSSIRDNNSSNGRNDADDEISEDDTTINNQQIKTKRDSNPNLNLHLTEHQIHLIKQTQLFQLEDNVKSTDARLLEAIFRGDGIPRDGLVTRIKKGRKQEAFT